MTGDQRYTRLGLSDTIIISAGKGSNAEEYVVHTSFATRSSAYIKAALNRVWKEAEEKRINIVDAEPGVVEAYLNWVYSKEIPLNLRSEKVCGCCKEARTRANQCIFYASKELAKMYVLGDYLSDFRFCNAVADIWKSMNLVAGCYPSIGATQYVWQNTSTNCILRELVLESWKSCLITDHIGAILQDADLPQNFTIDLLVYMGRCYKTQIKKDTGAQNSPMKKKCSFHKHVDKSDKCS